MTATPILDKARTDELDTFEVETALRELEELNGGSSRIGLEFHNLGIRFQARIIWLGMGQGHSRWCPSIEDALVAEHDEIKRNMAGDAA